ncbi:MAG: 16S rRNA (adenine(1518)-N(6)/adenine(1519)-N(6))-dimethyltransferase RsmA [Acidobacteriota bacterium]|nr:16S rRNA (adenine(1518)-N(6)/adenine(1519)-N(6))-dimethyltransferase RsmA [Blastocatellia bacterium]MDW8238640.1 16S rRNA (adenine(1518)-N(6)/adenine(1519)-N(6))-dimethyltransferase RsmA [Acidobacteriota bacterium]
MRAKKRFGQHFLVDQTIGRRLVSAIQLEPDSVVIEIGPGRGALTKVLLQRPCRVIAVEVDDELTRALQIELADQIHAGKLVLIAQDILKTNLDELLQQHHIDGKVRILGNLPYNIATAILQHLIAFRQQIDDMTIMLQREVVDRILSQPGTKQYGYLSVLMQYFCEGRKLFTVSPGAFRPVPKVTSTVVQLKVRERPAVEVADEAHFLRVVSALFMERRKTIMNNLKRMPLRWDGERIAGRLRHVGIDPSRRAETLSLEEFARVANALRASAGDRFDNLLSVG